MLQKTRRHARPESEEEEPGWLRPIPMGLRSHLAPQIRIEKYVANGRFVVRADVAGADPDKEVEVRAGSGRLTITERRSAPAGGVRHGEFRHGTLTRTIPLPREADDKDITASYSQGMLEVSVGLREAVPDHPITIAKAD